MHVTQILNADSLFRTFQAKPKAFRQKLKRGFMHSLTAKGLCQKFGTNFSIFQIVGNKRSVLSMHAVFRFKSKQKNVWCTANMEIKSHVSSVGPLSKRNVHMLSISALHHYFCFSTLNTHCASFHFCRFIIYTAT